MEKKRDKKEEEEEKDKIGGGDPVVEPGALCYEVCETEY